MTYKSNPVNKALDKVTELSGVPRLKRMVEANQTVHRARRQIAIPAITIAGSIIAFVAILYGYRAIGALGPFFSCLQQWHSILGQSVCATQ